MARTRSSRKTAADKAAAEASGEADTATKETASSPAVKQLEAVSESTTKVDEMEEQEAAAPTAAQETFAEAKEADSVSTAAATPAETAPAPRINDRMARFKALKERAKTSADQNLKASAAETQRLAADPSQLGALRRKHATAAYKLLKADVEDEGGDFERKRAWDWTAEESEKWDKRVRKREAHRDNNAFQDYRQEAHKVYKRQLKANLSAPDLEQYARDKLAAVERAAAEGTLEIVETEDGELIAVDKSGKFLSSTGGGAAAAATAEMVDSTSFADNRPSREAIDRLVADQHKAEEAALRKRRERLAKNGEDADVTYINEKNKQFNQKLARFYNKYTAEIRESFERGTMI